MKKYRRGFLIGLLLSILLLGIAHGKDYQEQIEVQFNLIRLTVNGEEVQADNILYKDTTYVPIRAVAEMLGKEVTWDQETRTAGINDSEEVEIEPRSKYRNGRFGFSVEYPEEWEIYPESQNGDGCFLYKDEDVMLSASGIFIITGDFESLVEANNPIEKEVIDIKGAEKAYRISYYNEIDGSYIVETTAENNGIKYSCTAIYRDGYAFENMDNELAEEIIEVQNSLRVLEDNIYNN